MSNNSHHIEDDVPISTVINEKILAQEDKLKKLNIGKAPKSEVDKEEKILLQLKADYHSHAGKEWSTPPSNHSSAVNGDVVESRSHHPRDDDYDPVNDLSTKIENLQNRIRNTDLKKTDLITTQYNELLNLKADYETITGTEWRNPIERVAPEKIRKQRKPKRVFKKEKEVNDKKEIINLGLEAKKEENLTEWYSQVITRGELIEYYHVSGCYILRPWAFSIWEVIKDFLDKEIKKLGVQNCYFPLFIPKSVLEKEKALIANFTSEVAWVTKTGESNLSESIAIRPTSETVMYPFYSKWLQSYRDLPIKLNQWNNVVRWEFKQAQPFIRSREFLWQEGHTAFAEQSEADEEVYKILDLYEKVYSDLLAVPVIKGRKTEREKFPGSDFTTTIEAFVPTNGKAIQGATSHFLGQNFSRLFKITYEDPKTQKKKFVYQNCWAITTRTIGIMVLLHSDNKGLVLPPRVAVYQVVIVPCGQAKGDFKKRLEIECKKVEKKLATSGIRVYGDYRDNYTPGWKFNHWELKGVPVRLEIGANEIHTRTAVLVRRDTGDKIIAPQNDIVFKVQSLLERIQKLMLQKAQSDLRECTVLTADWTEFVNNLNKKRILLSPFCGGISCENKIRQNSAKQPTENENVDGLSMGAKGLCTPFKQPKQLKPDAKCINPDCTNKPSAFTYFGRSY